MNRKSTAFEPCFSLQRSDVTPGD